jgi:hypothetical protein
VRMEGGWNGPLSFPLVAFRFNGGKPSCFAATVVV